MIRALFVLSRRGRIMQNIAESHTIVRKYYNQSVYDAEYLAGVIELHSTLYQQYLYNDYSITIEYTKL